MPTPGRIPDIPLVANWAAEATQGHKPAIFTHTAFGKGALEQLDTLESVSVKPRSIAVSELYGPALPKGCIILSVYAPK